MLRRFMWPSRCATPKVVRNQDCRRLLWCIERWTNWNFSGFVARRWIVTFRFLGICLIPPPPEKCFGCRTAASNNFMFGDLASNFPYWFIYFLLLAHFLILLIAKILQQFLRLFMPLSLSLYIYILVYSVCCTFTYRKWYRSSGLSTIPPVQQEWGGFCGGRGQLLFSQWADWSIGSVCWQRGSKDAGTRLFHWQYLSVLAFEKDWKDLDSVTSPSNPEPG